MRKYILLAVLLTMPTLCFGAELLVKASPHWMDGKDTSKMSEQELVSFNARSQIGDIIVVRPDGWQWGRCECPPEYVVIKLPTMTMEDAKKYEQSLMADEEKNITRQLSIADFNDPDKKYIFLQEQRFTNPDEVVFTTKEENRIASIKTEDYNKAKITGDWQSIGFINEPIDKTSEQEAKGNIFIGYVWLEGKSAVVEATGNALVQYTAKCRQYALDTGTVDLCALEPKGAKEIPKVVFDIKLIDKAK